MNDAKIKETLLLHKLWFNGEYGGERANFRNADLRDAYLSDVNLSCAYLIGANLRGADFRDADLRDANLRGCDLRDANFRNSNLSGANLRGCVGNMREIKSLQIDTWAVTYTADTLQIGCQRHSIDLWRKSDPRWIAAMDSNASEWWSKFGPIILGLIDASPALSTGKETQ